MENQLNLTSGVNLFKQNYKFINFQKSAEKNDPEVIFGESVRDFYQDLIQNNDQDEKIEAETKGREEKENSKEIIEIDQSSVKKIDSKEFLKACQNNDLEIVADYLSTSGDIFYQDPYKWNCVMISIVSFSNKVLKFIVENIQDINIFNQLLDNKDLSGDTAESLAQKIKNSEAIEILKNAREKLASQDSDPEIIDEDECQKDEDFYCENCGKKFNLKDISHREHKTSIVHLINENIHDLERSKKILTNYHLRGNNKGYQLMIKSGWNERGLGSKEQGRTMPIRTRQKLDRLGIGIDKNTKKYTRPFVNIKLKSSKSDSAMMKKAKNLKDTIEENKRSQRFERNLRRYFDL